MGEMRSEEGSITKEQNRQIVYELNCSPCPKRSDHESWRDVESESVGYGRRRMVQRRIFLKTVISAASICLISSMRVMARSADMSSSIGALRRRFDNLLQNLSRNSELLAAARGDREYLSLFSALGLERAPVRASPSTTPISERANALIVAFEVTSPRQYAKSYQRPTWPRGESGVTIGIGYDVGYVTKDWLKADWSRYIADGAVTSLNVACGVTGNAADRLLASLQDVVISWSVAQRQFQEQIVPRYVGETEMALPNTKLLSPDSLGAVVSLVYNRGASFSIGSAKDHSGRYEEMRNIREHMIAKAFDKIPAEIRSMRRLWQGNSNMAGLVQRRELEASLFELGLRSARVP
jgi:GH24 family phage-related lysozyme (muramidase)